MDPTVELRRLLHASGRPLGGDAAPPRLLVVAAGKAGVGSTTLAVNLSVSLAGHGLRTVLIDADLTRADVAAQCGLPDQTGIGEVLTGRRSIHEVLARGPGGLQVVVGSSTAEARNACTDRSVRRVVRQVQSLGRHADLVLVDVGASTSAATLSFWQAASEVILVAIPDAVAVMDTYATVKTLLTRSPVRPPMRLVVNQSPTESIAADVHHRIDRSCRRFLGLDLPLAAWLPPDASVPAASRLGIPPTIANPAGPLAMAIDELASELLATRDRMTANIRSHDIATHDPSRQLKRAA
jgi:flagellar biosynthesis protein FlhG